MNDRCKDIHGLLDRYIDGELPTGDVERVEAHLSGCAEARREVDELRALHALVRQVEPPEPAEHFWDWQRMRVLRHLRTGRRRSERPEPRPAFAWLRLATVAGGLMVVAIVAVVGWRLVLPGSIDSLVAPKELALDRPRAQERPAPATGATAVKKSEVPVVGQRPAPAVPGQAATIEAGTARDEDRPEEPKATSLAESRPVPGQPAPEPGRVPVLELQSEDGAGSTGSIEGAGTEPGVLYGQASSRRRSVRSTAGRWVVPSESADTLRVSRRSRPSRPGAGFVVRSAERPEVSPAPPPAESEASASKPRPTLPDSPAELIDLPSRENAPDDSGTTVLRVRVEASGAVSNVLVKRSSGSKVVDDFAVRLARKGRYRPAIGAGQPVAAWLDLPVTNQPAKPSRSDRPEQPGQDQ